MPKKIRLELYEIMHRATIKEMIFFKNKPIEFIKYAAQYLKMEKLMPQGYFYKENDSLDKSNINIKYNNCSLFHYKRNNMFMYWKFKIL